MTAAAASIAASDIDGARAISIANVAREHGLALKKCGHEFVGPCPYCGGTDRFSINVTKQVFNCRGCGGKGRGAISFVMWLGGCGFRDAVETLTGRRSAPVNFPTVRNLPAKDSDYYERRRRHALDLWREAGPTDATAVAAYLTRRGLHPPSPDVIRFHPRCPFGQDASGRTIYTPAMLALVRNIITNEPQAIHRTALDRDGNKVKITGQDGTSRDRMALGSLQGGAVKLTDDAEVTKAVGIGEGIESTLSLQQLPEWIGSPVWSLLSKNGVRDFPVLSGIETLMIAVDHDAKQHGQKAVTAVTARWSAAGCEVLLAWPTTQGDDINDVVRGVS